MCLYVGGGRFGLAIGRKKNQKVITRTRNPNRERVGGGGSLRGVVIPNMNKSMIPISPLFFVIIALVIEINVH